MNKSVGEKIKMLRKKNALSQEQVADALNISQSTYARIENGESHSWACYLRSLCNFFKISPAELFSCSKVEDKVIQQDVQKILEQHKKKLEEQDALIKEMQIVIKYLSKSF